MFFILAGRLLADACTTYVASIAALHVLLQLLQNRKYNFTKAGLAGKEAKSVHATVHFAASGGYVNYQYRCDSIQKQIISHSIGNSEKQKTLIGKSVVCRCIYLAI